MSQSNVGGAETKILDLINPTFAEMHGYSEEELIGTDIDKLFVEEFRNRLPEIIKKAHELAKEINGYIYGEKENGGTNTIYVSPVPFEELNKAIEKGKGKPHLKPVEDMMAKGNNLVKAMAFAPLAGVAAAVGKYYKMTKNK